MRAIGLLAAAVSGPVSPDLAPRGISARPAGRIDFTGECSVAGRSVTRVAEVRNGIRSLGALVLVALTLTGCDFFSESETSAPALITAPPSYLDRPTVQVERGRIEQDIRLEGRVAAELETALAFDVPGLLQVIHVRRGEAVRAGDVVAELDTGARVEEIAAAQEELERAEQRLNTAEAELFEAQAAAEEALLLAQSQVFARQHALDALLAGPSSARVASAQAAVATAEAAVALRRAEARRIEETLPAAIDAARADVEVHALRLSSAQDELRRLQRQSPSASAEALAAAEQAVAAATLALAGARYDLSLLERPAGPPALQIARASTAGAEASLASAAAELEALRAGADEATIEHARTNRQAAILRRDAAQRSLAAIRNGELGIAHEVATLRETAGAARSRLAELNAPTTDYQLTAPRDGVVTYVPRVPGTQVKPGEAIVEMADVSTLVVRASVPRGYQPQLAVGQAVHVVVGGLEGVVFQGRVAVLPHDVGAPGGGTVRIDEAKITADWADADVEIGMRAVMTITLQVKNHVLKVPITAVRTVNLRQFVEALIDGRRRSLPVRTGIRSDSEIEIIDGVEEGAVIFESY